MPDETNGVKNAVSCYKEAAAVQFSASFCGARLGRISEKWLDSGYAGAEIPYKPSHNVVCLSIYNVRGC